MGEMKLNLKLLNEAGLNFISESLGYAILARVRESLRRMYQLKHNAFLSLYD